MKKLVKSDPSNIFCMSVINPQLCKQLSVQIEVEQRDEGPIPHMHVYLDKHRDSRNCSYIRLDKAEYSTHHGDDCKKLTKKQKKDFLQVMTDLWKKQYIESRTNPNDIKRATGYEAAVDIWIDTFGETVQFQYDQKGFPVMPDYSLL